MNEDNCSPQPPKTRRRLSLSLRLVTNEELLETSKGVIPKNTKRRNNWAAKNLLEWAKNSVPNDAVPD